MRRIEPELSWPQQLLLQVRTDGERVLARIGWTHAGIGALAQRLAPLDREFARWARLTAPHTLYAYCFCSVE